MTSSTPLIDKLPLLDGDTWENLKTLSPEDLEIRREILRVGIGALSIEERRFRIDEILNQSRAMRESGIPDPGWIEDELIGIYQAWLEIWWDTLEDKEWRALFDTENPQ